ncbi:GFA family protein [Phenylobacterium sp.]|uniref:GFA family protein n=1 Tax=Phenylobacterium sp. TaxID=1871053 RepID=UPI00374CD176
MSAARHAGGCLCGQVRWQASAEPINVRLCHCRNCQRATGGPYFARALFNDPDVERTGETTRWASSQRLHRLSCARCGTPVFAEPQDGPWIAVALTTLDDPLALSPGSHIWVSAKLPWTKIDDGLPQHPEGN